MQTWAAQNWFNLLSAFGIIASLLFTAISLRSETKTRRISNLLSLTQNHRELWGQMFENRALEAVFDPARNLIAKPVTKEEYYFIIMAIQHLHSAFKTMESGLVTKPVGIKEDIRTMFVLPVPRAVWNKVKHLQNEDFVKFVENSLAWK